MHAARTLAGLGIALALAACATSRPRRGPPVWWPPPLGPNFAQTLPNYALGFAIPAGAPSTPVQPTAAPATSAPIAAVPADDVAHCLGATGTLDDCKFALALTAKDPAQERNVYDVYKRACGLKEKLLGCGVFKSSAVGDSDRPAVELLMLCEAGRPEACEDVKTSSAPLVAWRTTLKTDGCKRGFTALCANYKECKHRSRWDCSAQTGATGGGQVCGCVPRCEGQLIVSATPRSWPDGSTRAAYTCVAR